MQQTFLNKPDISRLQTDTAYLREYLDNLSDNVNSINQTVNGLLNVTVNLPSAPVANILWNGEVGHSVNSWHDTAYVTTDKAKEAAWFFSHNAPASSKIFDSTDVDTGTDTITITAHGFTTGSAVDLLEETVGTLPAPLAIATTYFLIVLTADTLQFATTIGNAEAGTPINLTTTGTATNDFTIQQKLISTDARTSSVNNTLKTNGYGALTAHSTYNLRYCRWNATNGWAELTDTKSVDILIPSNVFDATTPLARVSIGRAAKKNSYIEITDDCLMGVGIWDNTSGQRKFLEGDLGLTAQVNGTPAATVERRYKIHVTTDRGFSLLSSEVTLLVAPTDASFTATANVSMTWKQTAGFLQVDIYEFIPSLAEYRLLAQVSSGNSYVHLGSYLSIEAGYPTATGDIRSAVYYTREGELSDLATDGNVWDTINFPNEVPDNYNKGNTNDRQWVRVWLTVAPNLLTPGVVTDGTTTISSSEDLWAVEYNDFWNAGTLVAEVMDENETLIQTTTVVAAGATAKELELADAIAAGTNRIVRIVAGGFHGVFIDKIHLGFQQNTSYAANALDSRTLQPVAAPSESTQGGSEGGSGGGIEPCVIGATPIKQADGTWVQIESAIIGTLWASPEKPNILGALRKGFDFVRRVRSANGVEVVCTDSERFARNLNDVNGTPLRCLRVGDSVLTEIDGRLESVKITEISDYIGQEIVYTPTLSNNKFFIAGEIKEGFWFKIFTRLFGRKRFGGFILHNNKPANLP